MWPIAHNRCAYYIRTICAGWIESDEESTRVDLDEFIISRLRVGTVGMRLSCFPIESSILPQAGVGLDELITIMVGKTLKKIF
jgi:hypothetical protein